MKLLKMPDKPNPPSRRKNPPGGSKGNGPPNPPDGGNGGNRGDMPPNPPDSGNSGGDPNLH